MTASKGRPQGGNGGARPDAASLSEWAPRARKLLLSVDITDPAVLRAWVGELAGAERFGFPPELLTPAWLLETLLRMAGAGQLEVQLVEGRLLLASACSDTPAECRVAIATKPAEPAPLGANDTREDNP